MVGEYRQHCGLLRVRLLSCSAPCQARGPVDNTDLTHTSGSRYNNSTVWSWAAASSSVSGSVGGGDSAQAVPRAWCDSWWAGSASPALTPVQERTRLVYLRRFAHLRFSSPYLTTLPSTLALWRQHHQKAIAIPISSTPPTVSSTPPTTESAPRRRPPKIGKGDIPPPAPLLVADVQQCGPKMAVREEMMPSSAVVLTLGSSSAQAWCSCQAYHRLGARLQLLSEDAALHFEH
jgi:hypothetical protein